VVVMAITAAVAELEDTVVTAEAGLHTFIAELKVAG
jgi:hypothetical protein